MTQPTTPPPGDPATTVNPTTPPADPAPPVDPPADGVPAGDKRAVLAELAKERDKRQELERQVANLAPLEKLASLLGGQPTGDGKTDLERLTERLDGYEQQIAQERQARWRAEIAAEKGLPPALAARLQGSTREELAADADALAALIPAAPASPRTPAPDPTQGPRAPADIDALIRDAETKGNVREAIRLKNQKLHAK